MLLTTNTGDCGMSIKEILEANVAEHCINQQIEQSLSESVQTPGSVQNGVAAYDAICRGCAQKFEDYYIQNEGCEDPVPWCDKCIKTMEP